jgi:SAM-dependent methyltransferase
MSEKLYKEYWLDIDPDRFDRYKTMFQWSPLTEALISPANIGPGHVVVDVGCGPGFVAVELAKRVGAQGHVHAIDINPDFVEHAKQLVRESGLTSCITVQVVDGGELPFGPSSIDRVLATNVMVYVDDPAATYREFRRVLKSGGIAHAVDSDWDLAFAEPVPRDLWNELMLAVAPSFRTPNIGRRLFGYARAAGFSAVEVQVASRPDTTGRLLPMVRGLCDRAKRTRAMDPKRIEEIERVLADAVKLGTLLILNPQFMVTAVA